MINSFLSENSFVAEAPTLISQVIDGKAFLGIIQEICKPIGNGTAWTLKNPKDNSFSQEYLFSSRS